MARDVAYDDLCCCLSSEQLFATVKDDQVDWAAGNDALDEIERFLLGLDEHAFQIPEKIAAIRAMRLRERAAGRRKCGEE